MLMGEERETQRIDGKEIFRPTRDETERVFGFLILFAGLSPFVAAFLYALVMLVLGE